MKTTQPVINGVRILKKGVKDDAGKYYPAWYSLGGKFIKGTNEVQQCVTIYAREVLVGLPAALKPTNNTDISTDYFEKDHVDFAVGTPEFELLKPLCRQYQAAQADTRSEASQRDDYEYDLRHSITKD